jgi:diguanylate cyclase (GGDEF)-like protein
MERVSETWLTVAASAPKAAAREACLVLIYPTGTGMGTRYPLSDRPLVLGRGNEADLRIDDHSVSRRHARIQPGSEGYYAIDLQSTNGTFINDQQVEMHRMEDGDYLRVGNCIYRFLAGGNLEAEYHEEIYRLTIMDALTEIYNKRYLFEFLERELARSARYSRPLALVLFDIDHFKEVNDKLGHLGGDFTLRELAARVRERIRREELFSRYGGDEFAVVLPETTLEGAITIAERIRTLVADTPFQYEDHTFSVTVSLGVATTSGEEGLNPAELLRRADERLYQAKHDGRNRVAT